MISLESQVKIEKKRNLNLMERELEDRNVRHAVIHDQRNKTDILLASLEVQNTEQELKEQQKESVAMLIANLNFFNKQEDKISHLEAENQRLFEAKTQEEYKEKKCMQCKSKFLPFENESLGCVFHKGKMKFYSCKGCGADEYFDCCNKCT